jgi:hypothetical protein
MMCFEENRRVHTAEDMKPRNASHRFVEASGTATTLGRRQTGADDLSEPATPLSFYIRDLE